MDYNFPSIKLTSDFNKVIILNILMTMVMTNQQGQKVVLSRAGYGLNESLFCPVSNAFERTLGTDRRPYSPCYENLTNRSECGINKNVPSNQAEMLQRETIRKVGRG
jgi:hypothetical protein